MEPSCSLPLLLEAAGTLRDGQPCMAPVLLASRYLKDSARDMAKGARRLKRLLALLRNVEGPASRLADLLPGEKRVATISWSSTVMAALRLLRPARILVLRSEPGGEGERTALALREAGMEAEVVPDSAAARALAQSTVCLVGADAVGEKEFINKVGTFPLLASAAALGVPSYVLAGEEKILPERLFRRVRKVCAREGSPFEVTPLSLVTAVVTQERVIGGA